MSFLNLPGATHFATASTNSDIIVVWSLEMNSANDGIYVAYFPKVIGQPQPPGPTGMLVPRADYIGVFNGGDSVENLFLYYDIFTDKPVISFVTSGGSPQKALVTGWINGTSFQPCQVGAVRQLTNSQSIYDFSIEFFMEQPSSGDPKFITSYGIFDKAGNPALFADRHG